MKSEIEAKIADVRKVGEGEDIEAMKKTTDELGQLIQKIGTSVYETQEAGNSPSEGEPDPSSSAENDEDVINGEVKE